MVNLMRRSTFAFVCALVLGILAACGGSGSASTPIGRVETYVNDFTSAMNDKDLSKPEVQEKWADTLSKNFIPEEQAAQKTDILGGMGMLGAGGMKVEFTGLKFETVNETADTAEVKVVEGKVKMEFMGQTQEQDVAEAGVLGNSETITLKKVDGTWYLDDPNK